jgi:hypothetical protein
VSCCKNRKLSSCTFPYRRGWQESRRTHSVEPMRSFMPLLENHHGVRKGTGLVSLRNYCEIYYRTVTSEIGFRPQVALESSFHFLPRRFLGKLTQSYTSKSGKTRFKGRSRSWASIRGQVHHHLKNLEDSASQIPQLDASGKSTGLGSSSNLTGISNTKIYVIANFISVSQCSRL